MSGITIRAICDPLPSVAAILPTSKDNHGCIIQIIISIRVKCTISNEITKNVDTFSLSTHSHIPLGST